MPCIPADSRIASIVRNADIGEVQRFQPNFTSKSQQKFSETAESLEPVWRAAARAYRSFFRNTRMASPIGTKIQSSKTPAAKAMPVAVPRNSRNSAPV